MDFFIADTHFFDENIIKYENRPFADTDAMLKEIMRRWNETVAASDRVFVLGDWISASQADKIHDLSVFKKFLGHKFLIRGNHDKKTDAFYAECGFIKVYDFPVILDNFWILSHEPLYVNNNMPYANIYGHVHGNDMYKDYSAHSYCVSAERIDYKPIKFDIIKERIAKC